ncbi:MAG: MFS transporter [Gordonia sp. (in: high G+C Gram-positive bacteria)]|uniref:MFS transporter n=1 Tax=Gordonia sp. (in: high G+C Gram-positive bacteria) TaxID=84139 RepID=UPI003BB7BA6C
MGKWLPIVILCLGQFVMVLDSTVMNVSISAVVADLDTSVSSMQSAITFYTLTMAALMLLGGKLGDIWGRRRAFVIGSIIYAAGSLTTALSQGFLMLFVGWSIVEGIGAVLVIPAIAALTAANYQGADRVKAFAAVGAVSGVAAAVGPLVGGFVTTYFSWRYVFAAEVVIMAVVLVCVKFIGDDERPTARVGVDVLSFVLSATGLVLVVFGMLQSKTWGWLQPRSIPEIGGHRIAPFGISLVAYLLLAGAVLLVVFYRRQIALEAAGGAPLLRVSMLKIPALRSGLSVLLAQYLVVGAVFFIIPIYLQMTLGLDALETGIRILPLSVALVLFSILGTALVKRLPVRMIVRLGQLLLVVGTALLLGAVEVQLDSPWFRSGMFVLGAGIGMLASQLGNINLSAVDTSRSSEVGGVQGVAQNLGSSLGTALIGSVVVAVLTTSFAGNVASSALPDQVKTYVAQNSTEGVSIVSVADVQGFAESKGLSVADAGQAASIYAQSQVDGLRAAIFGLLALTVLSLVLSRNIPRRLPDQV